MMQERRLLRADGRKLAKRTGERAAPVVDDWGDDDVQLGAEGDEKGEEGGGGALLMRQTHGSWAGPLMQVSECEGEGRQLGLGCE